MTMTATAAYEELRSWVLTVGRNLTAETLRDATPLFEARHITSLQVPELLLKLEELRGTAIDFGGLKPGDLKDLGTIYSRFLQPVLG